MEKSRPGLRCGTHCLPLRLARFKGAQKLSQNREDRDGAGTVQSPLSAQQTGRKDEGARSPPGGVSVPPLGQQARGPPSTSTTAGEGDGGPRHPHPHPHPRQAGPRPQGQPTSGLLGKSALTGEMRGQPAPPGRTQTEGAPSTISPQGFVNSRRLNARPAAPTRLEKTKGGKLGAGAAGSGPLPGEGSDRPQRAARGQRTRNPNPRGETGWGTGRIHRAAASPLLRDEGQRQMECEEPTCALARGRWGQTGV